MIVTSINLVLTALPRSVCINKVCNKVALIYACVLLNCRIKVLRGTQLPNRSGNSEIKSSLMRSFIGPRIMTGLLEEQRNFRFCWLK